MTEVVKFGLFRNKKYFGHRYKDTSFCLYEKYTYEDVCRLLDWEKNEVSQNIGGYKHDKNTNTIPIFVNYEKGDNVKESIRYEDGFIDEKTLEWISKVNRKKTSKDVISIQNSDRIGIKIDLFVRKNKDDKTSKEFYYLGRLHTSSEPIEFKKFNKDLGKDQSYVKFIYTLETPVRQDIYDYLVG